MLQSISHQDFPYYFFHQKTLIHLRDFYFFSQKHIRSVKLFWKMTLKPKAGFLARPFASSLWCCIGENNGAHAASPCSDQQPQGLRSPSFQALLRGVHPPVPTAWLYNCSAPPTAPTTQTITLPSRFPSWQKKAGVSFLTRRKYFLKPLGFVTTESRF